MPTLLRFLLPVLILGPTALPAAAQSQQPSRWELYTQSGSGSRPDSGHEVCQPLDYFSGSPLLFDYNHAINSTVPQRVRISTEVTPLGQAEGRRVVQVMQKVNDGEVVMKRLLVQRSEQTYCAIYQLEFSANEVEFSPATLTQVEGQPMLMTRDRNGRPSWNEAYWVFDADGPILLDLQVIDAAVHTLLPPDHEVRWDYDLNMDSMCYQSIVWKTGECNACASGGGVTLKLGIRDHRLVVVNKFYDPKQKTNPAPCSN